MRSLLNFLSKYSHWIVFILLETLAILMLFNDKGYHNIKIIKGIRGLTGIFENTVFNIRYYFNLKNENTALTVENTSLHNELEYLGMIKNSDSASSVYCIDSIQYRYLNATIINNSTNKQRNFITLNKGLKDSIDINMAVVSGNGVVGITVGCSKNYSIIMSMLNPDFKISAKISPNGYFGSLNWNGKDIYHAKLYEIPLHVDINVGDTIVTSGYSAIFPEGIMIGTISDFEKSGSDFYDITVSLSVDFKKLHNVYIVKNLGREEQLQLEKDFI